MAGGGHGHGVQGGSSSHVDHHQHGESRPYEIPDYQKYRVEDVPKLKALQERLAREGLKDPWLRNLVWRYDPAFGTPWTRTKVFFFRGFKWGLLAFAITIAGEKAYDMYAPSSNKGHGAPAGHTH